MKWIKCSERLPVEEVLLWNGEFVYTGSLTRFFGVTEWCIGNDEYRDIEYFTHWMPLPEGPKDEMD